MAKFQKVSASLIELGIKTGIEFYLFVSQKKFIKEGLIAINLKLKDPIFNSVIETNLLEDEIEQNFRIIENFYKNTGKEWSWSITPFTKPNSLIAKLKKKGLIHLIDIPKIYMDLDTFNPLLVQLHHFKVKEVYNLTDFKEWFTPLSNFFEADEAILNFKNIYLATPFGTSTRIRHFVGFFKNIPVSTITIYLGKNAAFIQNLLTLPAYATRGFGSSLLTLVMLEAKRLGYTFCFLEVPDKPRQLYKNLGFKFLHYTHIYSQN